MTLLAMVLEFLIATAGASLAPTPTAWVAITSDNHFTMACGDDDGAEIACDTTPPTTESCE